MSETRPLFITNQSGGIASTELFLSSSSAKRKLPNNNGLVIVATVEGSRKNPETATFRVGDNITINIPSRDPVKDIITRIENDHKPTDSASPGQCVGFCLKRTTLGSFIGAVPNELIRGK